MQNYVGSAVWAKRGAFGNEGQIRERSGDYSYAGLMDDDSSNMEIIQIVEHSCTSIEKLRSSPEATSSPRPVVAGSVMQGATPTSRFWAEDPRLCMSSLLSVIRKCQARSVLVRIFS